MSDSPAAYLVADGKTLETFPQAPEKQAADFIGWYDGEQEISAPFRPEQDIMLVARYVEWDVLTLSTVGERSHDYCDRKNAFGMQYECDGPE